jgi:short-subunit dehydrogenase
MIDLAGRHIVVTGASAGIGAELCRQLGAQGCRVTLAARRIEKLSDVAAQTREAGGETEVAQCDVTSRGQVIALATAARARFGEIDVWVSNAGSGIRHRVLEATEDDMLSLYRINCLSSLWGYQAVIPGWLSQGRGGQVIDVNSVGGKAGFPLAAGYCAAKHAMSGLGDVLRQELRSREIVITTVYPGVTVSDFSQSAVSRISDETRESTENRWRRAPWFVRKTVAAQSTAHVARSIVRAMHTCATHIYPNHWAALAALIYNLAPGPVLRLLAR